MKLKLDVEEIRKAVSVLKPNNQLFEVRIIGKTPYENYSGIFKSVDNCVQGLQSLNFKDSAQVYFTLNEIHKECYSMAQKEHFEKIKNTLSDEYITRYQWLLIDCDPERAGGIKGISSNTEELKAAQRKAETVRDFLSNQGFSNPVYALSGNGYHLLYKVDFENNDANKKIVNDFLKTLDCLFTDNVEIDTTVGNPSRICKLYGCTATKGADDPENDRPHRIAKIIDIPDKIEITPITALQALIDGFLPKPEPKVMPRYSGNYKQFSLEQWLQEYNVPVKGKFEISGGTKYILDCCPFNPEHTGKDSAIFQRNDGAIGFHCFHNSCADKQWKDVRLFYEPTAYDKKVDNTPPVHRMKKPSEPPLTIEQELEQMAENSADSSEEFSELLIDETDTVTEEEKRELLTLAETDPTNKKIFEAAECFPDEYTANEFLKPFREIAKAQKQTSIFNRCSNTALRNIQKRNKKAEQQAYCDQINARREELQAKAPYFIVCKTNLYGEIIQKVNPSLLKKYFLEHHDVKLVRNPAADETDVYLFKKGIYERLSPDLLKGYLKAPVEKYDETMVSPQDFNKAAEILKTDKVSVTNNDFNTNENIIVFNNGVLHLDTMQLKPHDKGILSTIKIDCNYIPPLTMPDTSMAWEQAKENAPVFSKYLIDLTNGDKKVISFLLEFIAVAISNIFGYRFKSALFLVGESDTGKSQLLTLIQKLVGNNNCSQITLDGIEKPHGEVAVYGKRFAYDPDMGYASVDELEKFKVLTGGDTMLFDPKFKTPFNAKYLGLLAFGCNRLPQFGGDKGKAVYRRIIPYECTNVIPENMQNKHLVNDMYKEREEIVKLLIPHLLRTVENNYKFDIPDCCIALREQYKTDNDPIRQFVTECCQWRVGEYKKPTASDYTRRQIYQTYAYWYSENYSRYKSGGSERTFKDRMLEILGEADITGRDAMFETGKGRYYAYTLNKTGVEYFNEFEIKNNPQRKKYSRYDAL